MTSSIEISETKIKLGDIIQTESTNNDYHLKYFFVEYVDDQIIKLVNINDGRKESLDLDQDGCLTDTNIEKIILLSRSDKEGYASQNDLLPGTYIKIIFAEEVEITGKIVNLEEDMIEIEIGDDESIFIDFEYKGIPKNIPIKTISIVEQPTVQEAIVEKIKAEQKAEQKVKTSEASIEYSPEGNIIVNIPENPVIDSVSSTDNIIGKRVEFIAEVEVREHEQRYGIEIQTNDLLDELLSTIPDSARTSVVMERIHRLIRRFKELRENFSTFEKNGNITGFKNFTASYKPMVEHLDKMDTNLRWIIPVVKQKTKVYFVENEIQDDSYIIGSTLNADLEEYKNNMEVYKANNNYTSFYNGINNIFTPFVKSDQDVLKIDTINTDLEAIVDNLEDYYSYVYKKGDQIAKRRFFIQRYNLGMTKMSNKVMRSGKSVYMRENINKNDTVCIKSVIMLPKEAIEFSRVSLPGTSILARSSLSHNWMYYFRLLTKKTGFKRIDLESVNTEYNYEAEEEDAGTFLDSAMSFSIPSSTKANYTTLLETIIPRSVGIIRMLKSKYIGYNFHDMLAFYEPFMIYADNITYSGMSRDGKNNELYQGKGGPYQELRTHIIKNVREYERRMVEEKKKYQVLEKVKSASQKKNALFEYIKQDLHNQIIKEYGIKSENATATEVMNRVMELDNGRFYMSVCSLIMSHLYAPELADIIEGKEVFSKSKSCAKHVIAKKYTSLPALQKDNGKEDVFFDKEFDTTNYDILKAHQESQKKMSASDFLDYFTLVLKNEYGIEMAETVAKNIIAKKKPVEDGNYAVLIIYPTMKSSEMAAKAKEVEVEADVKKRIYYFKRKGDNWVRDNEMDDTELSNEMFCNSESSCFYDKKNEICDMADNAAARMKKIAKKGLFETAVALTLEEFKKEMISIYEQKEKQLKKTRLIKEAKTEEFSLRAYHMGLRAKTMDIVVSPYVAIREQILAQVDFVQKQENIILFRQNYCRNAIEGESPHWLYCKETNTKLLPLFLYSLAQSFHMGLYEDAMDRIRATQGKLSDDGDAIVDKHSGYVICYRDLVAQEEFDDQGFVIKTHDVIEKDITEQIEDAINAEIEQPKMEKKPKKRVFEDQTDLYIYNVASAICKNIGINIEDVDDEILSHASRLIMANMYSKDVFERKNAKSEKKVSYESYRNTTIFSITSAITFIIIQCRIPSFQPKRTYPGCVYSLAGYPLDNTSGNKSGLIYLSCILEKIRSVASEPWKSVSKFKRDKLQFILSDWMDKKILEDSRIKKMLELKRNYLIMHPEAELIPDEHSVEKWVLFQPPLIKSAIEKTVSGVAKVFDGEIRESLKTGHRSQHQHIGNIYKKIIEHTYSAVDDINKIVFEIGKDAMLRAGSVIFLENSCCEETHVDKAITYFAEKDENIKKSIDFVKKYGQIYGEIKSLSIPAFAQSHLRKTEYVSADSADFSEEAMYAAYIYYCKLNTDLPVPDDLRDICQEKIAGIGTMSFMQSIQALAENGRKQTKATLDNLMGRIAQRNRVEIAFSDETIPTFDDLIIQDNIDKHIRTALKTGDDQSLNVYLDNLNKKMQADLLDYIRMYGGNMKRSEFVKLREFIDSVVVWTDSKKIPGFIRETIHTVTNVIPSMLVNDSLKNMNAKKKHWEFAPKHYENLNGFIESYFSEIRAYNRDENVCSLFQDISMDIDLKDISLLVSQLGTVQLAEKTMLKIYKYCYLSLFSKIISESDSKELVLSTSEQITEEGVEIEISDDKQYFFQQVSQLLLIIFRTDMNNKKMINFSYKDLADRFHKDSLAEKKTITDKFKKMDKNERNVEMELKKYKLGDWFVDESVYKYKKSKYEEEIEGEGAEAGDQPGEGEEFVLEEGDEDRFDNE